MGVGLPNCLVAGYQGPKTQFYCWWWWYYLKVKKAYWVVREPIRHFFQCRNEVSSFCLQNLISYMKGMFAVPGWMKHAAHSIELGGPFDNHEPVAQVTSVPSCPDNQRMGGSPRILVYGCWSEAPRGSSTGRVSGWVRDWVTEWFSVLSSGNGSERTIHPYNTTVSL